MTKNGARFGQFVYPRPVLRLAGSNNSQNEGLYLSVMELLLIRMFEILISFTFHQDKV